MRPVKWREVLLFVLLLAVLYIFYALGYWDGEQDTIEWYESSDEHTCDEGCTA